MKDLQNTDIEIHNLIEQEERRQRDEIQLIASENYTSSAVRQACGSVLTNKYAEGYPRRRYYGGCEVVDDVELLAIERLKSLFKCKFANVQPHSGSQANQAAFLAAASPGDVILGMRLSAGGHLTHGHKVNQSGIIFKAEHYGTDPNTGLIDYDEVEEITKRARPKVIIAGASSYPRTIDFKRFRQIADMVGAILIADIAHFAGQVAAELYDSTPVESAHIVTMTTHKTLRGPRGGVIITNDETMAKKVDSALFPGIQGGPLMHIIAGKAVAFKEAATVSYKMYIKQMLANAKCLAGGLSQRGLKIVTGGTDSHMLVVDLSPLGLTGSAVEQALQNVGIICNKNSTPNDSQKPMVTSGIRLGTPAVTTRGMKEQQIAIIAECIADIIHAISKSETVPESLKSVIGKKVAGLCMEYKI